MRSPTLVTAVVIPAALSICTLSAICNLAVAGPVNRTTNAVATVAPDVPPAAIPSQARVYLFRGALGPIFSRGMDRLTDRLRKPASGRTSTNSPFAG